MDILKWEQGTLYHEVPEHHDSQKELLIEGKNGEYTYWDSDKQEWLKYTGDEEKLLKTFMLDKVSELD